MHHFLAVNLGVLAMLVADRRKTARSGARRRSSPPALCLRPVRHGTAECGDPTTMSAVGAARPTTSRKAQACLPGCRTMGHRPGPPPRRASSRLRHSRHRCVRWSASNAVKSRVRRLCLTPQKAQKRPRPSRQVGLPGSLMCIEIRRRPSTARPHLRSARWISSVCGRTCRVAMPTRDHLRPRHHHPPSPRLTRAPRRDQVMHVGWLTPSPCHRHTRPWSRRPPKVLRHPCCHRRYRIKARRPSPARQIWHLCKCSCPS